MESKLYLKPIHHYTYKKEGKIPLIIGVVSFKPNGFNERHCYKVMYEDGEIDYVPFKSIDEAHYKITKNAR